MSNPNLLNLLNLLDAVKNRVCDRCRSSFIIPDAHLGSHYQCQRCNRVGRAEDFPKATIFDYITANEETLAEKLVIKECNRYGGCSYKAVLLVDKNGNCRDFYSREKAIAATVAELKEVCK